MILPRSVTKRDRPRDYCWPCCALLIRWYNYCWPLFFSWFVVLLLLFWRCWWLWWPCAAWSSGNAAWRVSRISRINIQHNDARSSDMALFARAARAGAVTDAPRVTWRRAAALALARAARWHQQRACCARRLRNRREMKKKYERERVFFSIMSQYILFICLSGANSCACSIMSSSRYSYDIFILLCLYVSAVYDNGALQ